MTKPKPTRDPAPPTVPGTGAAGTLGSDITGWDESDAELTPTPDPSPGPDPTPPPGPDPGEDSPMYVTWWEPNRGRYIGGRHPADHEPPEGVEVHPYVNTRDLSDLS
jgi:hypothetical protein